MRVNTHHIGWRGGQVELYPIFFGSKHEEMEMENLPKSIIPANGGFIFHRQHYENCDAGPIHTDNTEIIAWAIEDGDIFPVVPDGIIREFSSDNLKACVVSPSGRTCVPKVGDYDSFANWERDALEEHAEARIRIKAKAAERVHPCGAVNSATQAVKQERAEAAI